jgi:hypothetical protein
VHQETCEQRAGCPTGAAPPVAARLVRPLHFPSSASGRCPASRGRYVQTPAFADTALGSGTVRIVVDTPADVRHGEVRAPRIAGWLSLKTHFFSVPAYQGPFLVRARSIGRPRAIGLGATPADATRVLVVPAGPTANTTQGWRDAPAFTFVKAPGCYGWQIDGLTFSELIVARIAAVAER